MLNSFKKFKPIALSLALSLSGLFLARDFSQKKLFDDQIKPQIPSELSLRGRVSGSVKTSSYDPIRNLLVFPENRSLSTSDYDLIGFYLMKNLSGKKRNELEKFVTDYSSEWGKVEGVNIFDSNREAQLRNAFLMMAYGPVRQDAREDNTDLAIAYCLSHFYFDYTSSIKKSGCASEEMIASSERGRNYYLNKVSPVLH